MAPILLLALAISVPSSLGPSARAQPGDCSPDWQPTFGGFPGIEGTVHCSVVLDDGQGPALFVGGNFENFLGMHAPGVVRWDGTTWSSPGGGHAGIVRALTVYDDGSGGGSRLYAGGYPFKVSRCDGESWTNLATPLFDEVNALAVFDDGSGAGPMLYAGGLDNVDGFNYGRVARWDGTSWSDADSWFTLPVYALTVF